MKNLALKTFTSLVLVYLTGCAPVKFYSNPELTRSSGLKYYTVKPYLLVERESTGNNVVKATVIYLPDLENPQYMVLKDGLGSRKIDLKLNDGSISTFGLATDPLIAESVEALSALISKSASAINDLSTLKGIPSSAVSTTITELYEVVMTGGSTSVRKIEIK